MGTNGTAARVTGKAADLPRNMKLPLWSALTLLSQLLPKNSMVSFFIPAIIQW